MNAENVKKAPKLKRRSMKKSKAEFADRTPFWKRMKSKFLSFFFIKKVVWYVFRLVLLVGISYVVLFPFFSKIAGSFMSPEDFVDQTVMLIPKNFTLDTYTAKVFHSAEK